MIMAMPRTKSSSMARPAVTDLAPPNNFMFFSPVAIRGRMSLFASSVAARVRASQHQGIGRQHRQVCARLAGNALATVARTQAIGDETGWAARPRGDIPAQ